MDCSDVEKKWTQYLSGNLSTEEEKQIEAHIDQCSVCDNKLSNELGSERAVFLNDGKQAKILKIAKWKNRIVNAVFVLSLALLITTVSGLLSGLYYLWGEPSRAENAQRVSNIMTELTMPNISPGNGHTGTNVFFKMTGSYELQKQLGREEQSIGTMETSLFFNLMQVVRKWNDGSLDVKLYFVHPEKQKEIVSEHTAGTLWRYCPKALCPSWPFRLTKIILWMKCMNSSPGTMLN